MNIFVDTSAFFALLAKSDKNHAEASRRWKSFLIEQKDKLFTSNYIVVETCALLNNRLGMNAVKDFTEALLPATTVLWVDEPIHFAAQEAMLATGVNGPSLVDCSSFALMHARGISEAFAYDKHFAAQSKK